MTDPLLPSTAPNARTNGKPDRFWAELFCYWHLCDNAACRRARVCRGDIASCTRTCHPQLPQGVRDWFETLMAAKYAGVPFDDAMARLEESGLTSAVHDWREAALAGAETPGLPHAAATQNGAGSV